MTESRLFYLSHYDSDKKFRRLFTCWQLPSQRPVPCEQSYEMSSEPAFPQAPMVLLSQDQLHWSQFSNALNWLESSLMLRFFTRRSSSSFINCDLDFLLLRLLPGSASSSSILAVFSLTFSSSCCEWSNDIYIYLQSCCTLYHKYYDTDFSNLTAL